MLKITIIICVCSFIGIFICWGIGAIMDKKRKNTTNDNRPFSDKHPNLQLVVGIFLVFILAAIGICIMYYFIQYIGHGINKITMWINDIASKMDAVVIVALITGAVTIITSVISSIVSKMIDSKKKRNEYLAQKRENPYGEFVNMIYKLKDYSNNKSVYTQEVMIEDLLRFSQNITLWGSKKVVKKWVKFRENGANPDEALKNIFLMEEIMNEMRKDLGLQKVKKGNLLAFFINDINKYVDK